MQGAAQAARKGDDAPPAAIVEVANLCREFGAVRALRNVLIDIAGRVKFALRGRERRCS